MAENSFCKNTDYRDRDGFGGPSLGSRDLQDFRAIKAASSALTGMALLCFVARSAVSGFARPLSADGGEERV
jgi:hypothetical protein